MTTMYINSKAVGNGNWKLKSVLSYCENRKISLISAYSITANCDYAYTSYLDLSSGKYNEGKSSDHIGRMGIM